MGGLRDIFKRKLAEQQEVAHETAKRQEAAVVERTGVQAEMEPKLRAIVLEAFEAMREVKWPAAQVLTDGFVHEPTGVTAYAIGSLGGRTGHAVRAEVVVDSNGKIVFDHPVKTVGDWPDRTVVSCYPLDASYERLLESVQRADEPGRTTLTLNSSGDVMYSWSTGLDRYDNQIYTSQPLAEYLATTAARTVAGT